MAIIPVFKKRLYVGQTNPGLDLGKCGTFDGANSRVSFPTPTSFNSTTLTNFTVAFWADMNSIGEGTFGNFFNWGGVGIYYNGSTNCQFVVGHSTTNGTNYVDVPLNGWHRVLMTWNDSLTGIYRYPRAFVDGIEYVANSTLKGAGTRTANGATSYIGDNSNLNRSADGEIDQYDVWNRVLSYDEIVDDFYFGNRINIPGKIFSLNMDETSGNYIDSVGGVVCTPTNVTQNVTSYTTPAVVVPARTTVANRQLIRDFGTSLLFPTASYVNFGNVYNAAFSGLHSVSAWIYPTELTGQNAIVTKQRRATPFNGHGFYTSGNKLRFEYLTTASTNQFIAETTSNCLNLNKWQHVAMVYNNKTIAFYVDGVLIASTVSSNNVTSSYSTTAVFNIGGRNNDETSGDQDYSGYIDDVKFWDGTALTAAQASSLYLTGKAGVTESSYWKMDEGSGTSVTDSTGAITGTITAATYSDNIPLSLGNARLAV